jgi:ABC-2 type transport system permease protein
MFLALIPLLIIMIFTGVSLKWTLILAPLPILLLAMFALGVGLIVSSTAIFFADAAEMYQVLLLAWLYLTPIIYPIEIVPENLRWIIQLNPMYHLVTLFRTVVLEGALPGVGEILITTAIGIVSLAIGWWVFTKRSDEFAYRI